MKRSKIAVVLAAFASGLPAEGMAQAYPVKPVRWIIPMPPGGGTDSISRPIAQKLSEMWGMQVIPDNRPGSGGTIGMAAAVKSPADGYTIVLGQASNVAVAPALYSRLPYDPVKDLQPVTNAVAAAQVIVSHPSFPAKSVRELVVLARAKPDAITYASSGNGTIGHLALEMLKSMAGVKMLHIPYNGGARATTAVLSGEVVVFCSSTPIAVPLIGAGKLKALGATGSKRFDNLPNVPTVAESGVAGYEAINWYGVFVPAGVPKDLVARLHGDIVRVLRMPEVQGRFAGEGGSVVANTPEEFGAFIRKEIPKWTKVVKDAGVKVD